MVCTCILLHLQAIPFLREVLFREAMVSMRQWQFKWVPPPVLDMLKTVFQGWCQSDTCENGFNVIKDHQRDTKSMATSRIQRYMLPHVEGVMEQFGRPELEPQAEDRAGHKRTLPKGAFDALAGQSSVPDERLRKIMMSLWWSLMTLKPFSQVSL